MIRRPPRSTQSRSSAASDVYKRQEGPYGGTAGCAGGGRPFDGGSGDKTRGPQAAGPSPATLSVLAATASKGNAEQDLHHLAAGSTRRLRRPLVATASTALAGRPLPIPSGTVRRPATPPAACRRGRSPRRRGSPRQRPPRPPPPRTPRFPKSWSARHRAPRSGSAHGQGPPPRQTRRWFPPGTPRDVPARVPADASDPRSAAIPVERIAGSPPAGRPRAAPRRRHPVSPALG